MACISIAEIYIFQEKASLDDNNKKNKFLHWNFLHGAKTSWFVL